MTASIITSLCTLLGATMLLCACGGGGASSDSGAGSGGGDTSNAPVLPVTQSSLQRELNPDVSSADLASVVSGNNQFALQAFENLMPSGTGNLVFSPYGVTEVVAMPAAGAQDNTLAGIDQAMSFALPQSRLFPALDKLSLTMQSATSGSFDSTTGQAPDLNIANGVWAQAGFSLQPSYLDTLAVNFGTGVTRADFLNAPDVALASINNWVAQQTDNEIQHFLTSADIQPGTSMVLANTILFKGGWQTPFPAPATQNASFTAYDGSAAQVPTMNVVAAMPYAKVAGAQAVDIPFVGNDVSMLVLEPDAGTIDSWQASLTPAALDNIVAQLGGQTIALSLPKFDFASKPDITGALKSLGMTDAFDRTKANFSGIAGSSHLSISAVLQQAKVSVDENGATAAAASATVMQVTATVSLGPTPPVIPVRIDHPFLFFIRERSTGTILFMGRVGQIGS